MILDLDEANSSGRRGMNAIAVVGHPASRYADVWAMLRLRGVAGALPSRREGMLPQEITGALCKAYGRAQVGCTIRDASFAQITPASVWNSLALDLTLGNLDRPLWGWADAQTIFGLDYWAATIPQLTFVLVYDEPGRVLRGPGALGSAGSAAIPEEGDVAGGLGTWVAYNSALIQFHLRHPGRVLLVHAGEVLRVVDRFLEKLQDLLDVPLSPASGANIVTEETRIDSPKDLLAALGNIGESFHGSPVSPNEVADAMQATVTEQYLVDAIVAENASAVELYSELHAVADIPGDPSVCKRGEGAVAAWRALLRQRRFNFELIVQLFDEVKRAQGDVVRTRSGKEEKLSDHHPTGGAEGKQISAPEPESGGKSNLSIVQGSDGVRGEEEMILGQLLKVQEELERYHSRTAELERMIQGAESALSKSRREVELLRIENEAIAIEKNKRIDQLKSIRFGKERRIDELKSKLSAARDELERRANGPADLSSVPGRLMLRVAAMRLLDRATGSIRYREKDGVGRSSDDDAGQG